MTWKNKLVFGDNLNILRDGTHIVPESVDLVYLDPPFNSRASYNVLFKERSGKLSTAQITAFEDTWKWGLEAEKTYHEIVTTCAKKLADLVQALRSFLGQTDMMAYVVMMAIRLEYLHRVLKPTGTMYVHCDTTASHFLKLVMDAVFGPRRFLNEITWKRSSAHSDVKQGMKRCGKIRDILLVYTKNEEHTWNPLYTPYTQEYLKSEYRHVEKKTGRRYKQTDLTAAKPGGDTEFDWRVKRPGPKKAWQADLTDEWKKPKAGWEYKAVRPYHGRYWAYSKANLIDFAKSGNLHHRKTGMPRLIQYADEMPGIPLQDLWDDIPPASGGEDLGYPTQKPEALLERIIELSSNKDELVLDPFCGCGTTIIAAERLKRRWIGIDITHLAIGTMVGRLRRRLGTELSDFEQHGSPTDAEGADALAKLDRFQFQLWAIALIGAHPVRDPSKVKGADAGIDGYINFKDDNTEKYRRLLVSVKSGNVSVKDIREFQTVVVRENAEIGVFLTLQEPTAPMKKEATGFGFYTPDFFPGKMYPRMQILTIQEIIDGTMPRYPQLDPSAGMKTAKVSGKKHEQPKLL